PSQDYILSLHDALPILTQPHSATGVPKPQLAGGRRLLPWSTTQSNSLFLLLPWKLSAISPKFDSAATDIRAIVATDQTISRFTRSEEHTSELQSRENLV